jgi:hypothetical protein
VRARARLLLSLIAHAFGLARGAPLELLYLGGVPRECRNGVARGYPNGAARGVERVQGVKAL